MANQVIFDIGQVPFGIGHPPPTHQMHSTCVRKGSRVPNLQMEFNYLNSFKSYGIFSDFVVPMWSLWSQCHPCCPHIIPVSSPHCPHSPKKVPMVCGLRGLHMLSQWSPCHPCHPHIIPVIPMSSRRSPHHPQPPRYPLHPPSTPLGVGGPQISKNAIKFDLLMICLHTPTYG